MSRYFPHNMGVADRVLRGFVIAPVAIVVAFAVGVSSIVGIVLLVLAAVSLATSATGVCPGYVPFGIDSHSRARRALLPH
jgi:Inner membrane protein YgaP-like, transmembrane domain